MGYKSSASLTIALSIFALPTVADVMDEYRDPSFTGGYVVGEYLFDEPRNRIRNPYPFMASMMCPHMRPYFTAPSNPKSRIKPSMARYRTKPRTLNISRLLVHGFGIVLVRMTSMQ